MSSPKLSRRKRGWLEIAYGRSSGAPRQPMASNSFMAPVAGVGPDGVVSLRSMVNSVDQVVQSGAGTGKVFLTAEWRYLVMLNYEVEPDLLLPDVPPGAELDFYDGTTFLSVVGFMFLNTRVLGLPIPMHRNFEEINLRFYLRRRRPEGYRRGVSFVKEIVPRRAIAAIARRRYNENYVCLPMEHRIDIHETGDTPCEVEYRWRYRGDWNAVGAAVKSQSQEMIAGSLDEFIAEHYWGYTAQADGGTVEYRVEHPRWKIWRAERSWLNCDVAGFYGAKYAQPLEGRPVSAFVADGSRISVYKGTRI